MFEEMAVFHIFGIVGNELLFRAYEWIALHELASAQSPPPSPAPTPPPSLPRSPRPSDEDIDACPTTAEALRAQATRATALLTSGGRRSPSTDTAGLADDAWLATLLERSLERSASSAASSASRASTALKAKAI